ncbi:AraC family transcriptional regulator [Dokdonella soli]|uniref:AraC family transcriptional regulator SphR n=1 Tax=Dokdonella soli TaxID=529810 RepID=A0ABP3TJS8_9GAMM
MSAVAPAEVTHAGDADARYTTADIPPNVLVHLTELAVARGIACDSWFAGLGLGVAQLTDPTLRVSYRQASIVIRRALRALDEPALGLHVGCNETVGSFGLLGLAMMTSRTFGDAMRVGIEHHRVCGSLLDVSFEAIDAREVALVAWPRFRDPDLLPFLCEELFASSLAVARGLVGPPFGVLRLELTYSAPAHRRDYAAFFDCELRFGADHNRAVIDARWLEHRLASHNPLTATQALLLCRQQLASGGAHGDEIVASVAHLLRNRLREHPRLPDVARTLNLSERSLRRRLADRGCVFREIHDRVRAERALDLLQGGLLSVAEIGCELGFSDPREFRRAFKRWTGMPPQAARQAVA